MTLRSLTCNIGIKAFKSMADATRSQVLFREMEEKMGAQQIMTEQRHSDVKGELAQIQDSVTMLSRKVVEVL